MSSASRPAGHVAGSSGLHDAPSRRRPRKSAKERCICAQRGCARSSLAVHRATGAAQPAGIATRMTRRRRRREKGASSGGRHLPHTVRAAVRRLLFSDQLLCHARSVRRATPRPARAAVAGRRACSSIATPAPTSRTWWTCAVSPTSKLSTAFLYRTEYVPQCRCKPNPWDAEAQERHRMYALVAAKRKGSKQAAAELDALTAKMKLDRPARPAQVAMPAEAPADGCRHRQGAGERSDRARSDRADDKAGRMGLGARTPRESRERAFAHFGARCRLDELGRSARPN